MALIGEMHYLTIGGNTYSIPVSGGSTVTIERALTSGTKSATISVDGTSYDLYAPTPNAGTVTSVRVQATSPVQSSTSTAQSSTLNTTISLANGYGDTKNPYGTKTANYVLAGPSSGTAAAPSFRKLVAADIPDLSETYLTSYTETDPTVPSWAKASTKPSYTASEVGAATSTHTHGNITNGGDITATAPTIANGDQIIINDNSASKITNGPTFDGSTTTTALTPKGTWESFSKFSGSYNDLSNKPTIPTVPTAVSAFTNDAGYITSADVPEGASAYTGTISAISTTASNGTNNGFARGDHVHNITSSTITSALGYTPYNSTNPNGYISSYTDEKLKWTASTSSNTYYPLQSTSTATTSTANTLNGISFYQYYNTAGGYRRLILGNSTAYTSTGGAYGTIRLYGTGATYYGDLNPGTLGANRTWTLPNATGTIALTSDIPDVSSFITDAGVTKITTTAGTHSAITNATGAVSFNVPTKTSHLTNDSNFVTSSGVTSITLKAGDGISLDTDNTAITTTGTRTISHADTSSQASSSNSGRTYIQSLTLDTYGHVTGISTATESVTNTDTKLQVAAVTSGTTYYPIVGTGTTAATRQYDTTGFVYKGTNGTTSAVGSAQLTIGNSTASGTANNKQGQLIIYGSTAYAHTISGAPTAARTLTLPDKTGTVALTSDIPDVSGFITTDSDENVKSTVVTAATTNYIVGSTTSTTTTGGLSKHASAILYTTADSGTSGYTQLRLGNTTATSSAGGKEGQIRLYGTTATYYVDLKAGAPSANRTITFPNATGTVALTSNIPTKTSDLTNDSGFITSDSDTKNTAGSTDTSSKIFLIGATSQADNPQTYSHDTAYVGTDGCLYSGGTKVLTAHQTYTSFTGKPTANATPGFGGTVTISQVSQSTAGQVSGTDRTITIPSTIATNTAVGLVKPWYTHTAASTGPTTGNNSTAVTVNAITTTSSRYYAVEADSNGRLFVNVPWSNNAASQATDTGSAWRKILGTHNSNSSVTGSVAATTGTGYYKTGDAPAFQPSTGILYAPQLYVSLATNEALYTDLQNLGWTDSIKTLS